MRGISGEDSPGRATLSPDLIEQNERIIASSPPISLSLIRPGFFFSPQGRLT